jgi:hypothetical protein
MMLCLNGLQRKKRYLKKYNKGDDMLETLFWLALGAFVGWNFPQPQFARNIQAKVLAMLRKE